MKNKEKPDILNRIKSIKVRRKLTALLAFFVMISTSYAMIHPGEALNSNIARSFMFFNEEEGTDASAAPDINALLDIDKNSGEAEQAEEAPVQEEVTEEVQNEETASAQPQEQSSSEPTSTPAETVIPTLEPANTAVAAAEATGKPTGTTEILTSADSKETSTPENSPSASPETTASAEPTGTPESSASAEPSASSSALPEETEEPAKEDWHFANWTDEDGEDNKPEIVVVVDAPYSAFPEGTTMKVEIIEVDEEIEKHVEEAVDDKNTTVKYIQAVDISFWHEGKEIEPAEEIKVSMKSSTIEETKKDTDTETKLVHIAEDKENNNKKEASLVKDEKVDLDQDATDDEIILKSDEFSVYVIVGTETITVDYLTADGKTYTITVELDEREAICDEMDLVVDEILEGTERYSQSLVEAKEAMGLSEDDSVSFARFFDIEIQRDGEKFEPIYPAKVTIQYQDALQISEEEQLSVVHFGERETEVIDDIVMSEDGKEVVYVQDGFSVTGTVVVMNKWNTWPAAGDYLLAVEKDGSTYLVKSNGDLLPVEKDSTGKITIESMNDLADLNGYVWSLIKNSSTRWNLKNGSNYLYPSKDTGLSTTAETYGYVARYYSGSSRYGLSVSSDNYMFDCMWNDPSEWNTTYKARYLGINSAGTKLVGNQASRTTRSYLVRSIHINGEEYTPDDFPTFDPPTDVNWEFEKTVYDTDITNTLKAPDTKKILKDNNDGTYDLVLSITGQSAAASDVNKVDVVVVIDRSTSMNEGNRLRKAVDAAKVIGTTESLFQNSGVQISVIDFDTTVNNTSQWFTSTESADYQNYVESLSGTVPNNHFTNWQQALKAAGNHLMEGREDAYKYVIFLTDGNPTVYGENGAQYGGTEGPGKDNDANWTTCTNAALPYAQFLIEKGAALYVVGCGDATNAYSFAGRAYYGDTYSQMSGAPEGRYLEATDDSLADAFASVAEEIIANFTYADVAFNDGITTDYTATTLVDGNVSSVSVKVTDNNGQDVTSTEGKYVYVDYSGGNAQLSFKYVKASDNTVLAADGDITEGTGENTGKFFDAAGDQVVPYTLKNGYIYSATFQVWPKQEAMDRIAELNNGAAYTEADEEKGIVSDGNGGYILNTNTHAILTYKTVTTVEGEDPVYSEVKTVDNIPCLDEEGNPASIELVTSGMYFQKLWHVGLDTSQFTKMYDWSYDDGEEPLLHLEYTDSTGVHEKTFVIMPIHDNHEETSEGSGIYRTMRERYSIAPGIMVATLPTGATAKVTWTTTSGQTYYVLETGHDYRLIEDEVYYNYEKLDEIYHPMILGDKMYNVKVSGTTITDMEVMDPELLTADNYLLSGINIVKKVQDASGTDVSSDNTTFYVKLTIKDKDGAEYTLPENYTQQQKWDFPIWYNEYSAYTTDSETGMISGVGNWTKDDIWQSGEVKEIKVGQLLQLKNVPYGAIVTIQEVDASGNVISTGSINNGYKLVSIEGGNIASVDYNTSYNAVITNQQTSKDVTFKKLKAGTTDEYLDGAKFKLLRVEGTTQTLVNDLSGMDDSGVFSIENGSTGVTYALAPGEYVLVEADPPQGGYIKLVSGVYFTVGNSVTMTTEKQEVDGVETEVPITAEKYAKPDMADENGLTLLIYNEQGAELPSTGGPGTLLYTLSGLALMLGAALMYGFRMRRRERRLQ